MRVLVCGGRDFGDGALLYRVLDELRAAHGEIVIIHGAARGADAWARCWARDAGAEMLEYPADWEAYGKAAGPIRNKRMLDDGKPNLVVAFLGGRGTADMVKQATARGIAIQLAR